MTLEGCYAALGGDYNEVIGRLRSERLVQKFVLKFPDDPSYGQLCEAMEAKDYETAFRAAHTIKGVCQNLGFTKLYQSGHDLCESLRGGYHPEADGLKPLVDADYALTVAAIREYQASLPPA